MHAIDTPFHIYVLLPFYVLFKLAINSIVQYLFVMYYRRKQHVW